MEKITNNLEEESKMGSVLELIDRIEADGEKKEATKKLVLDLLTEIEDKYGVDGEGEKPFHDLAHSLEFIQDSITAFDLYQEKYPNLIDPQDKLLVMIAGAGHDVIQENNGMQDPGKNEQESAEFVLRQINMDDKLKTIYSDQEKSWLIKMILATRFDFANHQQSLTSDNIQIKEDVLERVMALADLMALGDFDRQHWRGNRLFWEIFGGKYQTEDINGKLKLATNWFDGQIKILHNQTKYLEKFDNIGAQLYPDISVNIQLYTEILEQVDILQQKFLNMEIKQEDVEESLKRLLSKDKEIINSLKNELGLERG
ncbi:MAG: hypothetical protein UR93_C0004G0014 [Berkelbacteria bacterium GW2011_GWA2_35_9]|uniref:HD domain-containing protein n=1 Tax=Berkelbacteria bacterium GW2011_GWA2_35_9 TaxID=1618333 RepID=A0A0G0DJQ3_9BACT|nr:MAG: hypothetical protein UR93_C0004G0014 [Berkelbacteria bacterium GW2011_GWA2_35_9]